MSKKLDLRDTLLLAYIAEFGNGAFPSLGSVRVIGGTNFGLYFRNSSGLSIRGIELDDSDHLLVGGNSNPANLDLKANAQIFFGLNSKTELTLTDGVLAWGNTILVPIIRQASISSADGQTMTVAAQATTGAHVGGRLDLAGGAGTASGGTGGDVGLSGGAGNGSDRGNWYLGAFPASWQSMRGGGFVGDIVTAPTGNPSAGYYSYSSAGEPRWLTSGGVTRHATAVPSSVSATAQSASIGSTNIDVLASGVLYRVSVYVFCTTVSISACTLDVNFTYTDPTTSRTVLAIAQLDLTSTSGGPGTCEFLALGDGSTNLAYSTTLTGGDGSQRYSVEIRLERID